MSLSSKTHVQSWYIHSPVSGNIYKQCHKEIWASIWWSFPRVQIPNGEWLPSRIGWQHIVEPKRSFPLLRNDRVGKLDNYTRMLWHPLCNEHIITLCCCTMKRTFGCNETSFWILKEIFQGKAYHRPILPWLVNAPKTQIPLMDWDGPRHQRRTTVWHAAIKRKAHTHHMLCRCQSCT